MKSMNALGYVAAASFCLLLVGTNAINPVLPIYRTELGLSPLVMMLTFVSYVVTLVGALVILSAPRFAAMAPGLLGGSLVVAAIGDIMISSAEPGLIIAGRTLAGLSGGMGTGSASALVVMALGERGRAVSATGNLVGAVIGNAAAQAFLLAMGPPAMHWIFIAHAITLIAMGVALIAVLKRCTDQIHRGLSAGERAAAPWGSMMQHWRALASGSISWIMLSGTLVLLPSYFADRQMLSAQYFGPALFLICGASAQLGSVRLARLFPRAHGLFVSSIGMLVTLAGAHFQLQLPIFLGLMAIGVGTAISYRLSLLTLAAGAPPSVQGAMASTYAAVSYAAAAAAMLLSGFLGNIFGLTTITIIVFAACAFFLMLLSRSAPRLGQ